MTVFRGQGRPLYERCNSLQHSSVELWHFESNVTISLIFCVVYCMSLLVPFHFFLWPLYCLSCLNFTAFDYSLTGSWIYNYLCNQYLSSLMLCVRISTRVRCTPLCDKVCQWLATGRWFSTDSPVSSTNKTDRHDITEILLKVALNTIKQTNKHCFLKYTRYLFTINCYMYLHTLFA
jgi:hypothetical protein